MPTLHLVRRMGQFGRSLLDQRVVKSHQFFCGLTVSVLHLPLHHPSFDLVVALPPLRGLVLALVVVAFPPSSKGLVLASEVVALEVVALPPH